MNNDRRKLLKLLSFFPIASISGPLFASIENNETNPTIKLLNLALRTWQETQSICPALYVEKLNLNKTNFKDIQTNEFIAGKTIELEGLVLSKSEVASLANIALIIKDKN